MKVYIVKYENEIGGLDEVVYVTTDKDKAEEISETYVKQLCWIDEYPMDVMID